MSLQEEFSLESELRETNRIETIGRDVDENAENKIRRWKKALHSGTNDPVFQDVEAMEMFGLSWKDLMDLPERIYLSMYRIYGLKSKDKQREQAYAEAMRNYGR